MWGEFRAVDGSLIRKLACHDGLTVTFTDSFLWPLVVPKYAMNRLHAFRSSFTCRRACLVAGLRGCLMFDIFKFHRILKGESFYSGSDIVGRCVQCPSVAFFGSPIEWPSVPFALVICIVGAGFWQVQEVGLGNQGHTISIPCRYIYMYLHI
jgi:hypothetical protein